VTPCVCVCLSVCLSVCVVCVCVCLCVFVLYCNTPENELTGEARAASNHNPRSKVGFEPRSADVLKPM
jgi:hypothetical protein